MSFVLYKPCAFCEKGFKPFNSHQIYCSEACKQSAYRRRRDPMVGSISREKERKKQMVETKYIKTKMVVCETCGREFEISIAHTGMMYCNNACKQKAYRARKKASKS